MDVVLSCCSPFFATIEKFSLIFCIRNTLRQTHAHSVKPVHTTVNVQWIPAHVGLKGNEPADSEAKRCSTLPQSAASLDYITTPATLVTNQHTIAATKYDSNPHTRVHRVFTDMEHPHRCWPHDWTRDQCVTVAQLHTGHSPLLAAYLHRIGRRDSTTCPHCNGADETAEHLVLHYPAHDLARRESRPNLHYQNNNNNNNTTTCRAP